VGRLFPTKSVCSRRGEDRDAVAQVVPKLAVHELGLAAYVVNPNLGTLD